jgi:methylmalonyl-CoA/ethylmalonyl-CoA epimerase
LGNFIHIDHIGWAVNSVEKASKALSALGFEKTGPAFDDRRRNVRILMMRNGEGTTAELIEPLGEGKTPISGFLLKNGPAPYHCCFAIDSEDMSEKLDSLKKAGFMQILKPEPAPALGGNDVIFLYSKDIGLVELVIQAPQA